MRPLLAIALAIGMSLASAGAASAKNSKTFDYRFDAIWSTAVRLLRVDRNYKLTEKSRDDGYILFVFPGSGAVKRCPASLEIFKVTSPGGIIQRRVQLQIAHQPSYIEIALLDRLENKLRAERGEPPPPQRVKPKGKDKDKGGDDEDKGKNGKKGKPGKGKHKGAGQASVNGR
ncbi:MAG: hypothetical protein KC503_18300 [Myxococcales bacterium]|nr:hypothetical protein [Myxococcales bacterium]